MNILEEKNNKLMHRKELVLSFHSKSSPSKEEVIEKIAQLQKTDKENIHIDKIHGSFGSNDFVISAKVYEHVDKRHKFTTITRKERKKRLEEAKKVAEETKAKAQEVKAE